MSVYGLIEWDGSETPSIVVGEDTYSLRKALVELLRVAYPNTMAVDECDDFLSEHPYPNPDAPEEDLTEWLDCLRAVSTDPYVTVLSQDEVLHV